jgi:hypothetical protein
MISLNNYIGSKNGSGVYQNIINVFPKHDIYIESFLGSAAIMKKKVTAGINIGIDLDSSLAKFFNIDQGFEFVNCESINFLRAAVPLLNALHTGNIKVLVYCDPPYLLNTRRSAAFAYKHELTFSDHIEFLRVMVRCKFYVVISAYANKLYDNMLLNSGFSIKSFKTQTRKGSAVESIYFNFPDNLPKHEYTYIGNNFRERAAAKGRVLRNVSKINKMHPDERNYLISLLNEKSS